MTREKVSRASQIDSLRPILLAERARIVLDRQNELEVLSGHRGLAEDDQSSLLHEQFVALRQHRIERRKLQSINSALARLERGSFGECDECGEDIPLKRLKVLPWASHCVRCQEELDSTEVETAPAELSTA